MVFGQSQSAVAASLCRRTPNNFGCSSTALQKPALREAR
jgi:hypothetical protein